jgi:hypothetical protein
VVTPQSRTQAALSAVNKELSRRSTLLDEDDDVVSVTVTLKFSAGSTTVRGVVYHEERLARQAPIRHIG